MVVLVPFTLNEGFNLSNAYVIYGEEERTLHIALIMILVISIALHAKLLRRVRVLLKLRNTNLQLLNHFGRVVPPFPTNCFITNSRK